MALLGNLTGSSQFFNPGSFYNGVATQSLRFDDGSSSYLTKTFGSDGTGSGATCTVSCWVKRGSISNNDQWFFTAGASSPAWILGFRTADTLAFGDDDGNPFVTVTDRVFRDTSTWYHIVLTVKTSESDNADKYKIYVNGELQATTFSGTAADTLLGANVVHNVGRYPTGSTYFDGYMAEVNFVDGLALDPTYFGETKNGVWVAKKPNVSEYGTNGFRLQFDQVGVGTASTSTIGADTSGKTNHLTSSGIAASDCALPDSPENNFNTQNPLSKQTYTFSEGNLKVTRGGGTGQSATLGTFSVSSGKWYWEVRLVSGQSNYPRIGIFNTAIGNNHIESKYPANNDLGARVWGSGADGSTNKIFGDSNTEASFGSYDDGDIVQFALDMDNFKMYMGKNDTWYTNSSTTTAKANISDSSANAAFDSTSNLDINSGDSFTPCIFANAGAEIWIANFGQDSSFIGGVTAQGNTDANGIGDFYYAPPSGFLALCSANLPEPTIGPNSATQADDYFNTVLYTGNGSPATHTVGFRPNWVWGKRRDVGAQNHWWINDVTNIDAFISSDTTDAEATTAGTTFNATSFTTANNDLYINNNSNYVVWAWKGNGTGTATSNTSGSINSTVSANTTAGFSIVSYTGSESNATVGHGLGGVPDMLIWKKRNGVNDWIVYHSQNTSAPATDHLHLNNTNATSDPSGSTFFQDTLPTSTVFSIGTDDDVNDAKNYVVYCFRSIEGYSRFGSYTGNGNADGAFVFTGFRPAFVMVKRTDSAGGWHILDNKRAFAGNEIDVRLEADNNDTENTSGPPHTDLVSNGFKLRTSFDNMNASSGTYIYMAFAENPFKYANAR